LILPSLKPSTEMRELNQSGHYLLYLLHVFVHIVIYLSCHKPTD
jgi:hypothetical protein